MASGEQLAREKVPMPQDSVKPPAQDSKLKPGTYGAKGDPYVYTVREDGSITVAKDGGEPRHVAPDTMAYDAIVEQFDNGTLKPVAAGSQFARDGVEFKEPGPGEIKSEPMGEKPQIVGGREDNPQIADMPFEWQKGGTPAFKDRVSGAVDKFMGFNKAAGGAIIGANKAAGDAVIHAAPYVESAVKAVGEAASPGGPGLAYAAKAAVGRGAAMIAKLKSKYDQANDTLSKYNATVKGGGTVK